VLTGYIKEKLNIGKEKEKLKESDVPEELKKRIRNNDRMKLHILNRVLFPSMANLTFFFECIAKNYKLRLLFEDDIKELLGIRRYDPRSKYYAFMFDDLISAMLVWGLNVPTIPTYDSEREREKDCDRKNFRIRLINILQQIVQSNVQSLSSKYIPSTSNSNFLVGSDMGRALGWTDILAGHVEEDYYLGMDSREYERISKKKMKEELNIEEKKYLEENRSKYLKYKESLESNKPARTFGWTSI